MKQAKYFGGGRRESNSNAIIWVFTFLRKVARRAGKVTKQDNF